MKLLKPLAPSFHRHIVRSKLLGRPCRVGDRIVVYEVVGTEPEGTVVADDQSRLRFE